MTIGTNILTQIFSASVTLAFGLAGGVFALLFTRKSNRIEQALTDLFAMACLTALFLLSAEYGAFGQIHAYLLLIFAFGVYIGFISLKWSIKFISRKYRPLLKRKVSKEVPSSSQDNR